MRAIITEKTGVKFNYDCGKFIIKVKLNDIAKTERYFVCFKKVEVVDHQYVSKQVVVFQGIFPMDSAQWVYEDIVKLNGYQVKNRGFCTLNEAKEFLQKYNEYNPDIIEKTVVI